MIEVCDLTYSYPKAARPAIRELNFDIRRGEIFGFLGPNASGKSTTQNILIGLLRNYRGTVTLFGKNLMERTPDDYERIGVSFEFPNHFLKLTALENLTYFRRLYRGETLVPQTLLDMVGLSQDGRMPVGHYSKGMANRLNMARALLNRPDLLFLDEPTAGLDPINARRIKDLIREQRGQGRTVFLTTHDMTVADELCDRVAFIVDGQIKLVDRPRDLKLRFGQARVRVEIEGIGGAEHRDFPLAGLGEDGEFLSLLRENRVQTLHTMEATLEEVFLRVTGRELS
jgi:fluoroquinolone transport system ATP-binding protein